MSLESDQTFMRHAIRLAMNGRGRVEPNPMVGCVIVKDGRVIGEGFHQEFGGPHAEPNALANCTEPPAGATVYVTLEPCFHFKKKTPPCAPRLIESKVARVVVGCVDPNIEVNGKGLEAMNKAGLIVDRGILENECRQLIAPFFARWRQNRAYVTLKWAQTADAKVAGPAGARMQISGSTAAHIVHELRARCDAIMVGINTVLCDDPLLTARGVSPVRPLRRIVLDRDLRIPLTSKLVRTANDDLQSELVLGAWSSRNQLEICASEGAIRRERMKVKQLEDQFISACETEVNHDGTLCLSEALRSLPPETHVLVEPGPTLARSFFQTGLADRVWVFSSPTILNDPSAPTATPVPEHYIKTGEMNVGGDVLTEYLNPRSPVFFAPQPSADFVLAEEEIRADKNVCPTD
jgi:diaminohydroxyphosphoribosylaminopyrimidine deaminase/5-amino-6-(5-phosphoribosylamino)uracil reductase